MVFALYISEIPTTTKYNLKIREKEKV